MNRLQNSLKYATKRRKERADAGFVYIVQCQDFVKVGIADDVATRLLQLQTGNPHQLTLEASWKVKDMIASEKRLHALWQAYRVRGEWFRVPFGEMVCVINAETFDAIFDGQQH